MQTTSPPRIYVTDELFWALCKVNPDLRLERTAIGELIVNPPTGGETGQYNAGLIGEFYIWNKQTQLGLVFDSSTGFKLPNGATRSPDVSWIQSERWNSLTPEQQEQFAPIAPDFVLELMSPSDRLGDVQAKMQEYMTNGVRLGWLVNRKGNYVELYRPSQPVALVTLPATLSGEDILPGFSLDL